MDTDTIAAPTYGKACASCAKSKCRCVRRPERQTCERCFRLNKQCHAAQSTRRSNTETKSASKIASLENRLDELTSALNSVVRSTSMGVSFAHSTDSSVQQARVESELSPTEGGSSNRATTSTPAFTPGVSTSETSFSSVADFSRCSAEDAEKLVETFKTKMLKSFAFISLPAEMTARVLREQRPFLFLCIIAVTTKETAEKLALFKNIREHVAQRMLLEAGGTFDIDLLLGWLTYLVW